MKCGVYRSSGGINVNVEGAEEKVKKYQRRESVCGVNGIKS